MNWKLFFIIFFTVFFTVHLFSQEDEIVMFDSNWIVGLSLNYNEMGFTNNNESGIYRGNKPLDVGIGVKYKKLYGQINFNLPIVYNDYDPNPNSFDINMDFLGDKLLVNANFSRYSSFYKNEYTESDTEENIFLDNNYLEIITSGLSFLWILNHEKHSLRGIYELDRMQTVSNGSFLAGFGAHYHSIFSPDNLLENYNTRQHYVYLSPLFGYSYTWLFTGGFFINGIITAGFNYGWYVNENEFVYMPIITPNITFGYHLKTWSFTSSIKGNYYYAITGNADNSDWHQIYKIFFTIFKISKRF